MYVCILFMLNKYLYVSFYSIHLLTYIIKLHLVNIFFFYILTS